MRSQCIFDLKSPNLPLDYRRVLVSFLKHGLEKEDAERYLAYFDKVANRSKSFSFAVALPRGTVFEKGRIVLAQPRFSLTFSTGDLTDMILFFNAFMSQREEAYPLPEGNAMTLRHLRQIRVPTIVTEEITVRMLSPLVLRLHDRETNRDRYLEWNDPDFSATFAALTAAQGERLSLAGSASGLWIRPLEAKKTVVTALGNRIAANIGVYRIGGDPVLLNELQDYGVGSRRNAGFGLFEVIGKGEMA